ncbi:PBSX family phage terminase large subunit [Acetobacterium wieringae]|uniref:PBSX family phage terminase large subunit n=1 Tax=Acetobacterium wieringae TaxID=52694 RepID=UPI002033E402|nr:PBSX family phage terminase large subunit [Acetobacterium wieringae]URN85159.1 PBSX family phage terminase large subunit [Acetobacterium wieringae]
MAISKKTIPFRFSDKHIDYIRACSLNTFNFAEGAVRAGKTVDNVFAFSHEIKTTKDKIHLATGSTVANAKLNIGDANGFGLEYIFRGQCHWGKYKDNEALFIKGPATGKRQRIVIFAGGAKADSFKKIRGNSYGMWIATEINLHHDNTIKEAFNRQLVADMRKIFWDLNPDNPNAPIYRDYIDKYKELDEKNILIGGYNYCHFTIHDNITIPDDRKREIISQYDQNSIWYKRDIEGKRCIAEGLIFRNFSDDPERYILKEIPQDIKIKHIMIGVDFGGNKSKTTFVATGFVGNYQKLIVLDDYKMKGDKGTIDPDRLNKEFIEFVQRVQQGYPTSPILYAFCDNEAQTLINGMRAAILKSKLPIKVVDCEKATIIERIYTLNGLINTGRFFVMSCCKHVIKSLQEQVWDQKKENDTRLDDGTCDIDTADALEYSFSKFLKAFALIGVKKWMND